MKYVATITKVLHPERMGQIYENKELRRFAYLLTPVSVEIGLKDSTSEICRMFRYTYSGLCCGTTDHQSLNQAFSQATDEFGLTISDFKLIPDQNTQDYFVKSSPISGSIVPADRGLIDDITFLLQHDQTILAIMLYMDRTHNSLGKANEYVLSLDT